MIVKRDLTRNLKYCSFIFNFSKCFDEPYLVMACLLFKPHTECLQDVVVAGPQPGVDVGVHQVVHDVRVALAAVHRSVQVRVQSYRQPPVYRGHCHLGHSKQSGCYFIFSLSILNLENI